MSSIRQTVFDLPHRPPDGLLRRIPRQERGRERVDRVLDAAAEVIAEIGVEAATTNAIAARAATSVGSLYQFFPNKEAIVRALGVRYNSELRRINEATMPPDWASLSSDELIDRILTPFAQFYVDNPAYRHVYHALHRPDGEACDDELHRVIVERAELILLSRNPAISPERRHLQATVAVLTSHAILSYAMAASPSLRDGMVRELKRLIVAYVKDVASESEAANVRLL
jgi:AcrR family transcriptional regulator